MDRQKKQRLERAGWKLGSPTEFLGLSNEEAALVEVRLALAAAVKKQRSSQHMTQAELARLLGSSQSRVAKIEAADASVSIDLLVRSLLRMGTTRKELAFSIASPRPRRAA